MVQELFLHLFETFTSTLNLSPPLSYFSVIFPPASYAKEKAFSSSGSSCSETGMCVYKTRRINVLVHEFHYLPNDPRKLMKDLQAGSSSLSVKSYMEFLYLFKNKFYFMTCILFSSLNEAYRKFHCCFSTVVNCLIKIRFLSLLQQTTVSYFLYILMYHSNERKLECLFIFL